MCRLTAAGAGSASLQSHQTDRSPRILHTRCTPVCHAARRVCRPCRWVALSPATTHAPGTRPRNARSQCNGRGQSLAGPGAWGVVVGRRCCGCSPVAPYLAITTRSSWLLSCQPRCRRPNSIIVSADVTSASGLTLAGRSSSSRRARTSRPLSMVQMALAVL